MVGRKLRQVKGQTELDLFTDNASERPTALTKEHMMLAFTAVLEGNTPAVRRRIGQLSNSDRYRLRVACRILVLEAAKPDRIHPS